MCMLIAKERQKKTEAKLTISKISIRLDVFAALSTKTECYITFQAVILYKIRFVPNMRPHVVSEAAKELSIQDICIHIYLYI